MIRFVCPVCKGVLQVAEPTPTVRCAACRQVLRVPPPAEGPRPSPPPLPPLARAASPPLPRRTRAAPPPLPQPRPAGAKVAPGRGGPRPRLVAGGVAGVALAVLGVFGAAYYLSERPAERGPEVAVRPDAGETRAPDPPAPRSDEKPAPEPEKLPPPVPEPPADQRPPTAERPPKPPEDPSPQPPELLPAPKPPTDPPVKPPADPPVVKEPPRKEPAPKPPKTVEVPLVEDLPAGLEKKVLAAVNSQRASVGIPFVVLDARRSKACRDHARYLARNAHNPAAELAGRHEEDLSLPGATEKGRAAARSAHVVGREPLEAVAAWAASPAHRALLTQAGLKKVAFGFAQNAEKKWFFVFDWQGPAEAAGPGRADAVLYPLAGQRDVPLTFLGNEVPDPIPLAKDKRGGYPVTITFPARPRVLKAQAWLEDEAGKAIPVWFSSPEKPANQKHANYQGSTICLIAEEVLRPGTRYAVLVKARVDRKPWARAWTFTTLSPAVLRREVDTVLARLNVHRKAAGLRPVTLDPDASRACAAHAEYLARNLRDHPGLNQRDESPDLPGYTREGHGIAARALFSPLVGKECAEAIDRQMDFPLNRYLLLNPSLECVGIGRAAMVGGSAWVMAVDKVLKRAPGAPVVPFPAKGKKDVPMRAPQELKVPGAPKDSQPGYAVSAASQPGSRFTKVTARLEDGEGKGVECWLSTPEKPLGPRFYPFAITLVPKAPLKPATRYTVRMAADLDGTSWKEEWRFTTLDPARAEAEAAQEVLRRLNEVRKAAGFGPVRLDDDLSTSCRLHARYLARNYGHPAVQGLKMHDEDPRLPGVTPEGTRAGKASVIAFSYHPPDALDAWMASLYHRVPLLAPELRRVGYGQARLPNRAWVVVLDAKSGK